MRPNKFFRSFSNIFTNEEKRAAFKHQHMNPSTFLWNKKLWFLVLASYGGLSYYTMVKTSPQHSLKYSISRKVSQITGKAAQVTIPKSLRKPLYGTFGRVYHINFDEIVEEVDSFENFSKFFTRAIHPRPIDPNPLSLASPADSRILTFSEVTGDDVVIVKGIDYKLGELLTGVDTYQMKGEVLESMKKDPKNKLYQIILYLAPGDYHRFHSPCDFNVRTRNHIVGELAPVKVDYVKTHAGVYEKNERVNIFGTWNKGFMSMIFVGALNVGSIDLNFDPDMKTDQPLKIPFNTTNVKFYYDNNKEGKGNEESAMLAEQDPKKELKGIDILKGGEIGRFNMGSTVVMVFEASPSFEFKVQPGQQVKYGQLIGLSS